MPDERTPPLRLLAPIALAAFVLAFFVVVLSSGSGGGGGEEKHAARSHKKTASKRGRGTPKLRVRGSTYTVKTGDTLGRIADKTGVPVERLQELNPDLDPQALVSGQKIKLQE